MPRRFLKRYLPNAALLREHRALRPLGALLHNQDIWHMTRRSISGAAFIGFFVAWLPIPGQMLVAGTAAILFRCNLPLSVALVWVTNPLTMPAMFFSAYKLGAWLLDRRLMVTSSGMTWQWITNELPQIWQPLLLGSVIFGLLSAGTAFVLVRLIWRLHVAQAVRLRRSRRGAAPRPYDDATPRTKPRVARPQD
jgi:uncharacterized protein